jgi:hypothetical protein
VGETETGEPIKLPGIQEYVVPGTVLLEDKDEVAPTQMVEGVADGVTTGLGFTVTETVLVPEQPAAVPVTVYTVVNPGVTVTGEPLKLPGIQVKLVPVTLLVALNDVDEPKHIAEGVAVGVTTGLGLTTTVVVTGGLVCVPTVMVIE